MKKYLRMITLQISKQKMNYQTFHKPEHNSQNQIETNKKHYCQFCPYQSKYKWVVKRHTQKKHYNYEHSQREADTMAYTRSNKGNVIQSQLNNEKDVYLRLLSCGNCIFQTFSVEEMTKHKESMHGIIWPEKEKKIKEDEGDGKEDGRFENGYQLWNLDL